MYPTISFFLNDLFGINIPLPIQTFGFFVALAFIISSWTVSLELKRKEKEGILKAFDVDVIIGKPASNLQLLIALIIGFIFGSKFLEAFLFYSEFTNDPQTFILSTRGNLFGGILGGALNTFLKYKEHRKNVLEKPKKIKVKKHPYELVGNIVMIAAISGIIGAKVFHNLENLDEFIADPINQLLSFSGLTFYGGLILGAFSVIWYVQKFGINYKVISDAAAPGLMLAYGIGRMGCHFSGDGDWGINNLNPKPEWLNFLPDWCWAYTYPNNVLNAGIPIKDCVGKYCHELAIPVYPTAVYEIVASLLLFGLLWSIRKKITVPGMLFGIYLVLNGIERFFIEKIRVNTNYQIFGYEITQAEIISLALIIAGSIIVWRLSKKTRA